MILKRTLQRTLPASLAAMALFGGVSGNALACASEPFLGSVCIMGMGGTPYSFANMYVPAAGQMMNISQYSALYAVIGTTFGGDGRTTFALPNLQGRFVMGASSTQRAGLVGGASGVTLTPANMPAHVHTLTKSPVVNGVPNPASGVTLTWNQGSMAANTTLSGLTATTSMAGVTATVKGSDFTLNAGSTADTGTPSGSVLLGTMVGTAKLYTSGVSSPTALNTKSIGTTKPDGTANVTFTGNPTTTVSATSISTTLSGAPTLGISGLTDAAGAASPAAVSVLPPYLTMNYYVAISGLFPVRD